jgi:hypothetical protein
MALALVTGTEPVGNTGGQPTVEATGLAGIVRREFERMRRHRVKTGIQQRLLDCLRLREGKYDPVQLAEIERWGGSKVFANLTHNKCRGAAAMLRDIFLGKERPWTIEPTPTPTLPDDAMGNILQLVRSEVSALQAQGQQVDPDAIKQRMDQLDQAAQDATKKRAADEARQAADFIDDILTEGGFYQALDEFIYDFVTFPYAVITGPVAMMVNDVHYVDGMPQRVRKPILTWRRVDPADIWTTPGAGKVEDAAIVERCRFTRADINALIGLPGYDEKAIRSVLRDYKDGHVESEVGVGQSEIARQQNRDEILNEGETIDILCYTGAMYGRDLEEEGYEVDDLDLDYMVQVWVCGAYVLKVHLDPDPRLRVPYYIASYEPNPGSIAGTALPELFSDIQQICNACARSLVNNMGMASGPQVAVNVERLVNRNDASTIYPWKRWELTEEPTASAQARPPVEFFQPDSRSQDLIQVFTFFSNTADEISAVPKYLTGNQQIAGAGRTASGLSLLMGNASRVMKSVAANIDNNILEPAIQKCYDMVLLTSDTDVIKGDETIRVRGATTAEARETDRMRLLEFLQMTMNPIDTQIIGPQGRANVLRHVSDALGLHGEEIVPSEDELKSRMMQAQVAAAGGPPGAPGGPPGGLPPGAPGNAPPSPGAGGERMAAPTDNAFRSRQPGAVAPQPGGAPQ